MEFFPHNIQLGKSTIGSAVSASLTVTASFLDNFATIRVDSASLALNISGSPGTNGTNYIKTGDVGPTGIDGVRGFRGNSVFLLSSSWSTGSCVGFQCYTIEVQRYRESSGCNSGIINFYYSTDNINVFGNGSPVYYNETCTLPATNVSNLGQYGNSVYQTDGFGTASVLTTCGGGF